ncbi:MAG: DUF2141 domain-containing protein [Myxococcota bacterium]
MGTKRFAIAGLFLVSLTAATDTESTGSTGAELTVKLLDVDPGRGGTLRCGVYDSEDGFPMKPEAAIQRVTAKPRPGVNESIFRLPSTGTYAVACNHDEDDNGKTNKNLFGVPTEGWGTSNNVRPRLRAPKFEESRFVMTSTVHEISIRMGY